MIENILINDRYLIYSDGVIYDTKEAKDIPEWVFEIRNKVFGENDETL